MLEKTQSAVDSEKGKDVAGEEAARKIGDYSKRHSETGKYEYLTRGAILVCRNGSHKRKVNLPKCHGVYVGEHPVLHELECVTEPECGLEKCNITYFGVCRQPEGTSPGEDTICVKTAENSKDGSMGDEQGHRCEPAIIGTWMDYYEGSRIVDNGEKNPGDRAKAGGGMDVPEGQYTITTGSFLVCKYGGLIEPIDSGQNSTVTEGDFKNPGDYGKIKGNGDGAVPVEMGGAGDARGSAFDDRPGEPVGERENEWLQLYDGKTVDAKGRDVEMPEGNIPGKWSMREGLTQINKYALLAIEGSNSVITGDRGELVDDTGRYWVAVGPMVMNPKHKGGQECVADEMKYGTQMDVVVKDGEGNRYFIPCVVGDCKAHTYPNGVYQTGSSFPNGGDPHPGNNDGSVVEFCGKGSISGLDKYEIEKIIVYDEENE